MEQKSVYRNFFPPGCVDSLCHVRATKDGDAQKKHSPVLRGKFPHDFPVPKLRVALAAPGLWL